jgi:hypothetical protein
MSVLVGAVDTPAVLFDAKSHSRIHATIPSALAFRVHLANGSLAPAFTLGAPINVSMRLWVEQQTATLQVVHGNLSLLSVTPLIPRTSAVGTVHVKLLSRLIETLLTDVVVPAANAIIARGLPLPATSGLLANNTHILVDDGTLQVRTDFVLDPALKAA